jgi:hypothetical protein
MLPVIPDKCNHIIYYGKKDLSLQAKAWKETSRTRYTNLAASCTSELQFKAMFDSLSLALQAFDFELYYIC